MASPQDLISYFLPFFLQLAGLDKAVILKDEVQIEKVLQDAGLIDYSVEKAKKLVEDTSVIPVQACRDAILESVFYCKKFNIPVLAHVETTTKDVVQEVAKDLGPKLIAVHVNHTLTANEAINYAKVLKNYGAIIEIISADSFGAKQIEATPDVTFALLKENLVDVITTDFSGGYHDPILLVLQKAVEAKIISLPKAIQLATYNPTKVIPRVAPNRGMIEEGKIADLCVTEPNDISKVKYVFISGRIAVEGGITKRVYQDLYW